VEELLRIETLTKEFGGVTALLEVDFHVDPNEIVALIGPNGAGKTTAINIITGIYRPTSGNVSLAGRGISSLEPYRIAALGVARTFQNIQVFHNMTVLENVMVGLHTRTRCGFLSGCLHAIGHRREEREVERRATEVLGLMGLREQKDLPGTALPYGLQKRLEMARAWVSGPRILLLDEPAAGLNSRETEETAEMIARIRNAGTAVLLVEHNMDLVMGISDRVIVLNYGRKIAEGRPEEVRGYPEVIEAYLGSDRDA